MSTEENNKTRKYNLLNKGSLYKDCMFVTGYM